MKTRSVFSSCRPVLFALLLSSFLFAACGKQSESDRDDLVVTAEDPACSSAGVVPEPPTFPADLEWMPEWEDYEMWAADNNIVNHKGVGYLWAETEFMEFFWWENGGYFPMWSEPGGAVSSWFFKGAEFDLEGVQTGKGLSTRGGFIETDYEVKSLLVLSVRGGTDTEPEWLEIRLSNPTSTDSGTRWVHGCHLAQGERIGQYRSFQELFEIDDNYYYASGPLYSEPLGTGEILMDDVSDWAISRLQTSGDWMEVEVKGPESECEGDTPSETLKGWIPWRTEEEGPVVWFYTRGC